MPLVDDGGGAFEFEGGAHSLESEAESVVVVSPAPQAALVSFGAGSSPIRRRLVCVPYAGGGASTYRLWPRTLLADVEVLSLQLPGREPPFRTRPLDSIADIVSSALPALRAAADIPFALFGHSMGAAIAFELTVALEAEGISPDHLFVSARRSPCEPSHLAPVHHLPDDEFLDAIQSRYQAVPDAVRNEPELIAMLLPMLRADIRAFETYVPLTSRRVGCPLHVFGGASDFHPRPDQLAAWQDVAERAIRVRLFEGDHFYLTSQREQLTSVIGDAWTAVRTTPISP